MTMIVARLFASLAFGATSCEPEHYVTIDYFLANPAGIKGTVYAEGSFFVDPGDGSIEFWDLEFVAEHISGPPLWWVEATVDMEKGTWYATLEGMPAGQYYFWAILYTTDAEGAISQKKLRIIE